MVLPIFLTRPEFFFVIILNGYLNILHSKNPFPLVTHTLSVLFSFVDEPVTVKFVMQVYVTKNAMQCYAPENLAKEEFSVLLPELLPNRHPGVYQLDYSCNGRYIGQSKKKVLAYCIGHQQDSIKGNWQSSGTTEHTKEYHGQFN